MYLILDCNDCVVGDQLGYDTFKSVSIQLNYLKSPAAIALKQSYIEKYGSLDAVDNLGVTRRYCSISLLKPNKTIINFNRV